MKDTNRASRYGAEKASAVRPAAPTAATLAKIHHGAPAKNSTAMKTIVSATVVPRSGWNMISPAISTNTGSTGISSALGDPRVDRRAASTCAIHSSSASLAISLGWNWKPASRIQLRAPYTLVPAKSTTTSNPSEMIKAIVDVERSTRTGTNCVTQKQISPRHAYVA